MALRVELRLAHLQAALQQLLLQDGDLLARSPALVLSLRERGPGLVLARSNLRIVEDGNRVPGIDGVALAHANLQDAAGGLGGNRGIVAFDAAADGDDAGGQRGRREEDPPHDEGDRNQDDQRRGDGHFSATAGVGHGRLIGCCRSGAGRGVRLGALPGWRRTERRGCVICLPSMELLRWSRWCWERMGWSGIGGYRKEKSRRCGRRCDPPVRASSSVRARQPQQRAGKDVDQDLPHDAEGAKPGLVVVGRQTDHSADQSQQALKERAADLIDELAQRRRGLRQFVDQDAEVPVGPVAPADAAAGAPGSPPAGCLPEAPSWLRAVRMPSSSAARSGLLDDLGVEAQLVAEVIVDGGDIGARGDADFADGGGAIAAVGEDPSGNVEQLVAGGLRGCRPAAAFDRLEPKLRAGAVHISNISMKRGFDFVKHLFRFVFRIEIRFDPATGSRRLLRPRRTTAKANDKRRCGP